MNTVKWYVNNTCNMSCPFCFVKGIKRDTLSREEQFKVLDKLHEDGVTNIDFFGKEPLFDSTIFDIMKYGESKGYDDTIYSFITNGKNLLKYKDEIINSPLFRFTVSYDFHSGDREYMFNLEDLDVFTSSGFYVELSVDVHKDNVEEILSNLEKPMLHGVSSLYFNPIITDECISETAYSEFTDRVREISQGVYHNILFHVPFAFKSMTFAKSGDPTYYIEPTCTAGKTHFCISSDGIAFGCVGQCAIGNMSNTCDYLSTSFEDIKSILSSHTKRMCIGE